MRNLHTDIESASEVDLLEVGLDNYSKHPSTRILMVSWWVDGGPLMQWEERDGPPPAEFIAMLEDPNVRKWAHNAQFEQTMFSEVWLVNTPIEDWRCTMVWCYMIGLPGALEKVGPILKLPPEYLKFSGGKKLIKVFCVPQKVRQKKAKKPTKKNPFPEQPPASPRWRGPDTDPELWEEFLAYNRQDVITEHFIATHRLYKFTVEDERWDEWHRAQHTNINGWPIDRLMVTNAVNIVEDRFAEVIEELKGITLLDNPNSDTQFGPWIRARGYPYGNLQKATVKRAIAEEPFADYVLPLKLRAELKKTSVKKYKTILAMTADDGWLRFLYQFSGAARTGRAAGRGPQFQNLGKPYDLEEWVEDITEAIRRNDRTMLREFYGDVLKALAAVMRSVARAPAGYQFVVADLASIEACVIAWLAGCESMLDVFNAGLDIYKWFASLMFHKDYDDVTKKERNLAKPPVLGCGFRLSGGELKEDKNGDIVKTGLWAYADSLGISMEQEQAKYAVEVYRERFPEVVQFWYDIEEAAKHVIVNGGLRKVRHLSFTREDQFMKLYLPCGRPLHYLRPNIEKRMTPWGAEKWMITFEGMEDDGESKFWGRTATHGGKIAENATQAFANSLLRVGVKNAYEAGFRIAGESHDELITVQKIDDPVYTVERLVAEMVRIEGYPGLPLKAAGFTSPWYKKD